MKILSIKSLIKPIIFRFIQFISFNRIIWKKSNGVYLTFDDGPIPETLEILKILDKYNIKATFFVTGQNIEKYPSILKKIIEKGHKIGNHTYTHLKYNNNLNFFIGEIKKTDEIINIYYKNYKKIIRIPYGIINIKLLYSLIINGYKVIYWTMDSLDYKYVSKKNGIRIINSLKLKQGNIILFHDDTNNISEYLEIILRKCENYEFKSF